jgi:opacity protein-like surface antigen
MKNFYIAVLLVVTAGFCFGQAPKASLNVPATDVYVGYIMTSPDYGQGLFSFRFNGFEGAFTKGFTPHLGLIASGTYSFGGSFAGFKFDPRQFTGTVGVKYSFLTGRFRPYGTGQLGYAHQSSNGMYANDHHPPLRPGTTDIEDGLTYRMGAGADLQMTPKLYWRILQWDVQPMPWGRHTPYYQNFSSGVGYRF